MALLEKLFNKIDSLKQRADEAKDLRKILEGFNEPRVNSLENCWHFEFVRHYGDSSDKVRIPKRYNERFYALIEEIAEELEKEIESEL